MIQDTNFLMLLSFSVIAIAAGGLAAVLHSMKVIGPVLYITVMLAICIAAIFVVSGH